MATPEAGSPAAQQDVNDELARLTAERDAAVAKLDKRRRREITGGRIRRGVVGLLVFLFALLVPITATLGWVRYTVINTDHYVSTVGPIVSDPAVTAAISNTVTNQLYASLDPQAKIADALPPKAAFLAAPIANGVKGYVHDAVNAAVTSQAFRTIWTTANRVAHQQLIDVLNGKSKALQTSNGQVVLSVVPLLNAVLVQVSQQASELLGKKVAVPTVSGTELPSSACAKLSTVLSRPLPPNCGQIPLFPEQKLNQAQHLYRAFKHLTVALVIVSVLLGAGALWLTRRRRRTLMQLAGGAILVMVIFRRVFFYLQNTLINTGRPENKAARSAIAHQVLHGFFDVSLWVLWIGIAILVVAAVTGPYRWAVASRRWTRRTAVSTWQWTKAAYGKTKEAAPARGGFLVAHVDLFRVAGAALALIIILAFNVSWVWLLVILAVTIAYEVWLQRLSVATRGGSPA